MEYDIIIKNGFIIDGTGNPAYRADLAVSKDKIVKIAAKITENAKKIIDASNFIVAPGFIDPHTHSDISFLFYNNPSSMIFQGITTNIIGNCGYSPFPISQLPEQKALRRNSLSFIDIPQVAWDWSDAQEYFAKIKKTNPNINLIPLIGHGSIRAYSMGYKGRPANNKEKKGMCDCLRAHFELGVTGISTGLGYAPDFYSDTSELIALGSVVKEYDKIFTFHIRGERKTFLTAIDEVITVGKETGCKVHVSHLKCSGTFNQNTSSHILQKLDNAIKEGVRITCDSYPYTAGSAYLGLVFPPWTHEGGFDELKKRLTDYDTRKKIFSQMIGETDTWSGLLAEKKGENIIIASAQKNTAVLGKSIAEVAKGWNSSIQEACAKLFIEEAGKVDIILFMVEEQDIEKLSCYPHMVFCSDGIAMDSNKKIRDMPHPRSYGAFPHILAEFVRTKKILTLEEAIRKMSGLTADIFSIQKRGYIRENYFADIVIFDQKTIKDTATYQYPHQNAQGVQYLLVNGILGINEGTKSDKMGGNILLNSRIQ